MELHQLRYFVAVATTGNFSRAAERCFVSQPSLSQQISKLERHLKQRLFDRLPSGALLTEAGLLFLERATAILAAAEAAEQEQRNLPNASGGKLTVGAIPTVAPYLLPRVLERFLTDEPAAELAIHEVVTRQLTAAMVAGEFDIAIAALPLDDERLETEAILTEPLLLAVPSGHPLHAHPDLTPDDLTDQRFIVLGDMHCLGDTVMSFCNERVCRPRIVCRSAQISTIQSLIALGQGVSLIPRMALQSGASAPHEIVSLGEHAPTRTLAAVWNRQRYRSRLAERFLADLKAVCAESDGWAVA